MPPCGRTMTSEEFKMKNLHISRALRAALIGIAVIGVAAAVFGEADDAPGLVLLGFLLIASACALGARTARRRS